MGPIIAVPGVVVDDQVHEFNLPCDHNARIGEDAGRRVIFLQDGACIFGYVDWSEQTVLRRRRICQRRSN